MKASAITLSAAFAGLMQASSIPVQRSTGDVCTAPEGLGSCQWTRNCQGIAYPNNYCPNDPNDVQCCVNIRCGAADVGICRHTNQGCSNGHFIDNKCPGDNSIKCCIPNASATDTCANPQPNSCTFYTNCAEARVHCGSDGYPLGYGAKYCRLFTQVSSSMSPAGQAWVTKTMLCLQRALVPYGTGAQSTTCSALKNFAYGTHPTCYVNSGLCLLQPSDWAIIVATVNLKDLFGSLEALKTVLQTAVGCEKFYTWLIAKGIVFVVDKVEDVAESIWHKITSWF